MSGGIDLIRLERIRLAKVEGHTPELEASFVEEQMRWAAVAHLLHGRVQVQGKDFGREAWPWTPEEFKPAQDQIGDLVCSGAYIVGEIDRLLAAGSPRNAQILDLTKVIDRREGRW